MSTTSTFKNIENNHDVCRGKDCMRKFCQSLREHAIRIINFKTEKWSCYQNSRRNHMKMLCYICKEKFENKYVKDKWYHKVRNPCHYTGEYKGAVHNICNLKCSVPKKFQ